MTENIRNLTREAALSYAVEGWPVLRCWTNFPDGCACGRADCPSPGKHPYKTVHGVHDATVDLDEISSWRGRYNIGIALGHKGLVALDIDDTDAARILLAPDSGLRDTTGAVRTQRGVHIYFRVTGKVPKTTDIFRKSDGAPIGQLRSLGGYVVAPPSLRIGGKRRYTWVGMRLGDWIANLASADDGVAYAQKLLANCGVPAEVAAPVRTSSLHDVGDVAEVSVLPKELYHVAKLQQVRMILEGTMPRIKVGDRSRLLQHFAAKLAFYAAKKSYRLTDAELSGLLKSIDNKYFEKYTDRDVNAADREYMRSARKVLSLPSAQIPEKHQPEPKSKKTKGKRKKVRAQKAQEENPPVYVWDSALEQLSFVVTNAQGVQRFRPVANFKPEIIATAVIDDPDLTEKEVAWRLQASTRNGSSPAQVGLRAQDYSRSRALAAALTTKLPYRCTIFQGGEEHILPAIKELSPEGVPTRRVPAVPGWYEHDGELVYVLPGSEVAIGPRGAEESFSLHKEDLDPKKDAMCYQPFYRYGVGVAPPSTERAQSKGWRAFQALLRAAAPPLAGAVIFQILAGPLYPAGVADVPPLVHIVGRTGVLKTSYSLAALSLMGRFTDSSAPANWRGTPFGLSETLHKARHMTLLIDDYKKSRRRDMVGLIQQYADGSPMIRHSLSGHSFEQPRGLILSNGEDRFRGEASVTARTTTIEVKDGDISSPLLARCQQAADRGYLASVGAMYLQWLAGSGYLDGQELRSRREALHKGLLADTGAAPGHRRLLRSVASLLAVGEIVCRFVEECCPRPRIYKDTRAVLVALREHFVLTAAERASEVEELGPLDHFMGFLSEKTSSRDAKFAGRTSEAAWPDSPRAQVVGWHQGRDFVYLTEHLSFAYYQKDLRSRGEETSHDWSSITQDIRERFGKGAHKRIWVSDPPPPGEDLGMSQPSTTITTRVKRKTAPRWAFEVPASFLRKKTKKK